MKKEKNIEDKDKELVEIIETENFEVSKTGSLADDLMQFENINDIKIENQEVPDIEVQEIYIRETGNYLNLQENFINIPIEMIYFPFFTPQKQNKRINFKYTFEDLGVTMYSTLIPKDKKDKVFQPSIFEEKIYTFLISMYQEKTNKKIDDSEVAIEFEISDFIVNFLGNKMNRAYYAKVEQALKNLKNTIYQFEISNHTKFGKNKFEDSSFQLLNYQKLKVGKKTFYRVILNKNIVNKIKSKRYIKYNTKNLLEIMIKDPIASRIYKYISKIRYKNNKGEINVRTLAAIIPLKIEQRVERIVKNGVKEIENFENLILVTPTYQVGEAHAAWMNNLKKLEEIDFTGKVVGLVGLGNQFAFGESFCGGIRYLYDIVVKKGGKVVGFTSTDGYHYEETSIIENGKFIGLALDEENQPNLTPKRIGDWITEIKKEFK